VPGRAAAVLFASSPPATADDRAWSNGAEVVTERQADLPDRCFKCNAPAGGYKKKIVLRWHKPGWYLLILVNILVYAIVASFVSNKADLRVGLCPGHRTRHRNMVLGAWAAVLGPMVLTGVGIGMDSMGTAMAGLVLFLAGIIFAIVGTRIATPARVDEHFAHLKGAGPAFVTSLPRWEGYKIWMR
jgi:hypothetical protein